MIALVTCAALYTSMNLEATASRSQDSPVFRSGVDLVTVPFTVTDSSRQFVTDLAQEDFVVSDDGRRQMIMSFATGYVPASLGVLLDVSGSMTPRRKAYAQAALHTLFGQLGADDEVAFAEFADEFRLIAPWTTNRVRLRRALALARGGTFTGLYDAVDEMLDVLATGRHTRKVLLVISDGDDNYSALSGKQIRQTIRAADVMVYALGVEGAHGIDARALRGLTDDTGGRAEIVRGFESFESIVGAVAHELSNQYILAYQRPSGTRGRWREIELEFASPRRGLTIRARRGYVAN